MAATAQLRDRPILEHGESAVVASQLETPTKKDFSATATGSDDLFQIKKAVVARASTNKAAGRLNASIITDEEENAWLKERAELLQKKLSGDFTRQDERRLTYVRWSLDRIEDAKYGQNLDELEAVADMYAGFLDQVQRIGDQFEAAAQTRRR